MGRKGWTAHVGHDSSLSNMCHGVLDIFFDESAEPGVIELGRVRTRVSRTVFPKLDNFITGDEANRQASENKRRGENSQPWLFPCIPSAAPNGRVETR